MGNFSYDKHGDSLIVSNKQENEKVSDNYIFDDIVISMTNRGKIIGIEILNVSSYIENLGLESNILRNIKNAEMKILRKKDSIIILFNLVFNKENSIIEQKIPLMIPIIK